jgi:2-polyprenyl-6-methoxyphenol hydroxylase-like FAD-dependent oxidoreductase
MSHGQSAPPQMWDVVVIGGGPVGLAATIELAQRGIRTLLVERNDRVGHAPRAKTCNVRTCEHLRRWGIVERLRARAPFGVDYPSNIVFATRLAGRALARFDNAFFCRPGAHPLYAEHAQWIPQYKLEETLLDHARDLPCATLRFNTHAVALEQNSDRVRLTLQAPDGTQHVESRYVIAADGAGSTTRKALGISMIGDGALSKHRMLIFRAPTGAAARLGAGRRLLAHQSRRAVRDRTDGRRRSLVFRLYAAAGPRRSRRRTASRNGSSH